MSDVKTPREGTAALRRCVDAMLRVALPALAAGVAASLLATAVMLLLRLELGIVTLPELVGERILPHLDAGTFVQLLIHYGKINPLAYALTGQIVLGILVAPLYPLLARRLAMRLGAASHGHWPGQAEWLAAGLLALGMWLLALVLFWPVLAENLLGYDVGAARAITAAGLLAVFAAYGLTLALVSAAIQPPTASTGRMAAGEGIARRALLTRASVATIAGVMLGGLSLDALIHALWTRSNLGYEGMETPAPPPALTPASQFYVVSKNVLDPGVILSDWALEVGGLVRRTGTYDLAGLQALPSETRTITLECIANGVDGHLISTAVWRGVRLETLLAARGGVQPAGKYVLFTSADGYQSSLPLGDLLAVGTLLAWEMNGQPLPAHHGYPLRVVVPGRFGEQSPKWLTRIEIVDHPVKGFYQSQGWYAGPVYTISRIDAPGKGQHVPIGETLRMHGIAYGGARGIAAVDVSADGGQTWRPAALDPALSPQAWRLWAYDWTPTAAGAYTLVVRATDGTGALQIARDQGTVPNGGTGLHRVPVVVA